MWYSVELLENGRLFIQKTSERIKHGCKGKVILPHCTLDTAIKIKNENSYD